MKKFIRQTLTEKQRQHNARVAQKSYRIKRKKEGYRAFQRYIPDEIRGTITRFVDGLISKYEKKKVP